MSFREPRDGYQFPAQFLNPPTMAMGDSMYNGMRSATLREEFARLSAPALLARALDPDTVFRYPIYPEPLIVDFEELVRSLDLFDIFSRLRPELRAAVANAKRWMDGAHVTDPQTTACWDNIAQAGARTEDIIVRSTADWRRIAERVKGKLNSIRELSDLASIDVFDLHLSANALFLFNPENISEIDELRPIDIAYARKPKRLLINIGSNHGLVTLVRGGDAAVALSGLRDWAERMTELASLLVEFPDETRRCYVSTVPLPSTTPNLGPPYKQAVTEAIKPDKYGYYARYDARIGGPDDYPQYSGVEMRELDAAVADIKETMMKNMRRIFEDYDNKGRDRLSFFRLDQAIKDRDGKHNPSLKITGTTTGTNLQFPRRRYSNYSTEFPRPFPLPAYLGQGGIGSLDQSHPTGLGYSLLARALVKHVVKDEAIEGVSIPTITELGDRLLVDPPEKIGTLMLLYYKFRRLRAGLPPEPDEIEMSTPPSGERGANAPPSDEQTEGARRLFEVMEAVASPPAQYEAR